MNAKNEIELTRTEKIAILLKDNKKYLVIAAAAVVLILAGIGAVEYMGNQKVEKSVIAAEDIDQMLQDYLVAAEEDKSALKDELLSLTEAVKADYNGLYAHMRALRAEAELHAQAEEWTMASESYLAIADNFSESYIAGVALLNAATMQEEAGDPSNAVEILNRMVEEYKDVSADIPEALFNLGRLTEGLGDSAKAQEYYNRISEEYSSSSWTNLAKSRIIALKSGS